MSRNTSDRIVIVGGGVAGLSAAVRLAQAGLPVTVLEAAELGVGASTRNQGWLHSGALFAPEQAELARLCHRSLEQTTQFCPECVESDSAPMVYLASHGETDVDRWTSAWEQCEIPFRELPDAVVSERFPGLSLSRAHHAFELPDRSMRTDLLLARLAEAAQSAGVEIRSGTPVERLVERGDEILGVETESGERLMARLVVLAGNAKGGSLFPGYGAESVGPRGELALVVLKTHLVAARPQLSRWPLCVFDAEGFNHLPHAPMSVFGTTRWLPARHGGDDDVQPSEVDQIWDHAERLFPDIARLEHQVTAWAGSAVHAVPVEAIGSGGAPLPTVIDHAVEVQRVDHLVSMFPGRATLWPHLAEKTCELVLTKLQRDHRRIARPPWRETSASPASR